MLIADGFFVDSQATKDNRLPIKHHSRCETISYLVSRRKVLRKPSSRKPVFAFWGRLTPQKNLPLALDFFSKISRLYQDARFHILGPDGGEGSNVQGKIASLGLGDSVTLHGAVPNQDIDDIVEDACFYLQTSQFEGMAVSVVEAMQMGLVPIVTPVGEIANYCEDGHNAVIFDQLDEAVQKVVNLIEDSNAYFNLREAAMGQWQDVELYSDSFAEACERVVRT
ncbi:MAG: glycosyltransferase family 4 protein [Pseudomonadota bacterium]